MKKWKVKSERPEEIYLDPRLYYTKQEIEKYSKLNSMKKTQRAIAFRILEILQLKKGKLLDLGCGVGYTSRFYSETGFDVVGIDIIEEMLKKAYGIKRVLGDMRKLDFFKDSCFDVVVSASALQWIKNKNEIDSVARGILRILKKNGISVIQFYPKSEEELRNVAKIFGKYFNGNIIIDNPENPRKRLIFLILKKNNL